MDTTKLRKVDGSGKSEERPRYMLAQLLSDSDYSRPIPTEDREWIDAPRVGRELV